MPGRKPVNSNQDLKVNLIITVSSFVLCIGFVIIKLKIEGQTIFQKPHAVMPQSYKTQIKIQHYPGIA